MVEKILKKWDILRAKIGVIMTDSGSNMLKAFRQSLDFSKESEDEEEDESDFENFAQDFDSKEVDHDISFKFFAKRVSYFAHTIVQKFSEDATYKEMLKSSYSLVKRINKSMKATETLISRCGKKLHSYCSTTWSSTFLFVGTAAEYRRTTDYFFKRALEWDNLAISEWKTILIAFADYCSCLLNILPWYPVKNVLLCLACYPL